MHCDPIYISLFILLIRIYLSKDVMQLPSVKSLSLVVRHEGLGTRFTLNETDNAVT